MYGKELIIDLKDCDVSKFTRLHITGYFVELCELIDMKREALHFWDDEGIPEHEKRKEPHVVGITAIQFIITSNITIHTLSILKEAYINIFSCKDFNSSEAINFTHNYFKAKEFSTLNIPRGIWKWGKGKKKE